MTIYMRFLVVLAFVVMTYAAVAQVTLSNVVPRLDTNGIIMDIHDGNMLIIDGIYHWYGASYGLCKEPSGSSGCADIQIGTCGFLQNHNVSLYTSSDLTNWTFQGHVFSATQFPTPAVLFCPKVIYNALTELYVLWSNWIGATFADSYYAVATSPSPLGPFKLVNEQVFTGYNNTGDFNLFLDVDGSGYIIYTSHITDHAITHQMSIEKLASDFQSTEGLSANSGFFGSANVEAPALFLANGVYYATFGQCCCYCQSGAPVYVHTASSILGPYTSLPNPITSAIPAQQTNIFPYYVASGKLEYLWAGDRWQSAPDGIKGHDFTYLGPIVFNGTGIEALPFDSSFTISVYTN